VGVRVVTWNLWGRFGPWERRQGGIAAVLAASGADVICLQEVWSTDDGADQARNLADILGFHMARNPDRFHRGLSVGNAVLSRWPIDHEETRTLPGDGHRRVVRADLRSPQGRVPVFCTHLDYRFDESRIRQEQVGALVTYIAGHRGDPAVDRPVVLCGDFNAVPTADEIRILTGESPPPVHGLVFNDTWAAVGDGPGYTWDSSNPHLADAYWPRRRLDYVFVSWPRPKPAGNPVAATLIGTEPVDGVVPSDHYGVQVDLTD
jgi:endonuclease/exonuclease/phosphatase family metal-dependent hydrolase